MKKPVLIFMLLAFLVLIQIAMQQATASVRFCGERSKMVKMLKERYKEQPSNMGVSGSGRSVLEIFTNSGGKWTALISASNGTACIVAAGHSWQSHSPNFDEKT